MKKWIVIALLIAGCCPNYARLDRDEIMKYREVVITDLADVVHDAYGMRADTIAEILKRDGGIKQSHAEQEEFDDCVFDCMKGHVIPCSTDSDCWEKNGLIEEGCEEHCQGKLEMEKMSEARGIMQDSSGRD